MTLFFPDISVLEPGINLSGALAVCANATDGCDWFSICFQSHKAEADSRGSFFLASHILRPEHADMQAAWAFGKAGKLPLVLRFKQGTKASLDEALEFIEEYRKQGGITYLLDLPRKHWQKMGCPSLRAFGCRGMMLISSAFTRYNDSNTGCGWQAYGGMSPVIWRYTDHQLINGTPVNFNAYRGSLAQFKFLATIGKLPVPPPVKVKEPRVILPALRLGSTGEFVGRAQTCLNKFGAELEVNGTFDSDTQAYVEFLQLTHNLDPTGIIDSATWEILSPDN